MLYAVQFGESPEKIARKHGVSLDALVDANPHKPTQYIGGKRTWMMLRPQETISVPVGGMVGDLATDAISALVAAGGPCIERNAGFVCALQTALGLKADGKYGNDTAKAAKARASNAPGPCSPAPLWWGKKTDNKCAGIPLPAIPALPGVPSLPSPLPIPISLPSPAPVVSPAPIAAVAVQALAGIDPCLSVNVGMVCAAQSALGLKADGKYGADTAKAVKNAIGSAPPPCSPAPMWWGKKGESKCGDAALPSLPIPSPAAPPVVLVPGPGATPIAVPVEVVTPPSAPAPILSPTPSPVTASPAPVAPPPAAAPAPAPSAPGAPVALAPGAPASDKKLSTGAIVAGAVGAAALVGLVAIAATSGGKSSRRSSRRSTARRSKPRRKSKKSRR